MPFPWHSVYKNLMALGCPDFCLVAVSNLKWDHDMTPWYMGPISKHDTPCTGGADDYLKLLLDEIMPEAEALLPGAPAWRGLAGYSLAGLFALYALYQTDVFARAASISGSFLFEGIMEYVCSHEMKRKPDCLYFSLGDKESSTDNPILNVGQLSKSHGAVVFNDSRGIFMFFNYFLKKRINRIHRFISLSVYLFNIQ